MLNEVGNYNRIREGGNVSIFGEDFEFEERELPGWYLSFLFRMNNIQADASQSLTSQLWKNGVLRDFLKALHVIWNVQPLFVFNKDNVLSGFIYGGGEEESDMLYAHYNTETYGIDKVYLGGQTKGEFIQFLEIDLTDRVNTKVTVDHKNLKMVRPDYPDVLPVRDQPPRINYLDPSILD